MVTEGFKVRSLDITNDDGVKIGYASRVDQSGKWVIDIPLDMSSDHTAVVTNWLTGTNLQNILGCTNGKIRVIAPAELTHEEVGAFSIELYKAIEHAKVTITSGLTIGWATIKTVLPDGAVFGR